MVTVSRRLILVFGASMALVACIHKPPEKQRYLIFFQKESAALDDSAHEVITSAASLAQHDKAAPVTVLGFADPEGSPQANRDLSALRAQIVMDELVKAGIPTERLSKRAEGSVEYKLDSLESRRVEIIVGQN